MLQYLFIRNFVLVTESEIEFGSGMTVLTGETGAGKSIIFDALGLALGRRAESRFIRHNCDQAEVSATFTHLTPEILHWIEHNELTEEDGNLILRRVIRRDGRSRAFINGSPTTTQALREAATLLVDIQGQHAHQRLLKPEQQLQMLDHYADLETAASTMEHHYRQWREVIEHHQELQQQSTDQADRMALLQFQIDELERAAPNDDHYDTLEAEQQRLSHAGQLLELNHQSHQLLDGEEERNSALQQLHRAVALLESIEQLDPEVTPLREQLLGATLEVTEVANELQRRSDHYPLDPERLQQLNQHLSSLSDLARKHHCNSNQLGARLDHLQLQLGQLEQSGEQLSALEEEIAQRHQAALALASTLQQQRRQAAARLQQQVSQEIASLGIAHGQFQIGLTPLPDDRLRSSGLDEIEFEIKTNSGDSFHPLLKIASGGELSRVSLAIQLATASQGDTPTLIFDEVDSGVGGSTAQRIGEKLRLLGEETQILCVTHLPQVASQGHHHLSIRKESTAAETTISQITTLDPEARVEEIARMLGGVEITPQTRAHAREMLNPN